MKTMLALALLAVLGFTIAGCGATKKKTVVVHGESASVQGSTTAPTITVSGKSTLLMNFKAGTRVACKGWSGVQVTVPATGAAVIARSRGKELRLKRLPGGMIHVSCRSTR